MIDCHFFIIVVPCAGQGQDESVLLNKGLEFLSSKKNILFDIHAYEKWLLQPAANIGGRLQHLKQKQLPVIFGETAPMNAGMLMNPALFLDSVYHNGFSVLAWLWKYDATDTDALLDAQGLLLQSILPEATKTLMQISGYRSSGRPAVAKSIPISIYIISSSFVLCQHTVI